MKKLFIFLFTVAIITGCQKDEKHIFIPENHFKKFQTEKIQIFDLDTLSFKQIIGKNGTKISFNRNDFIISKNKKISLELIELYDFNEIIYKNINTITTDNELLETNGVLYISFKSDEKEIDLKLNKKIVVYPAEGKLLDNDVFKTNTDSLQNIKWELLKQVDTIFPIYKGGGVWVSTIVKKDSVDYFKKQNEKLSKFKNYNSFIKSKYPAYFLLANDDLGYINIDKLINIKDKITFSLLDKKVKFPGFNIYFTYDKLKSFIYNSRLKDDLKFDNIPLSGKTWITIIGEQKGILYYDKIELEKGLNNSEIILNMKEISIKNLVSIINN
ncbi:hypothetical protein SAMN05216503_3043 [Polaribacter sp. KT25b]|uniref:hypothetical protein n=1 Tax=Polaribacter sp. KT25b TaxID=1855336 RepID=UPI00087A3AE8|nr:hypothetical protein [Polaribacter sp. KT25b]SDS43146.1 hypothetical protein SAMN05216503_3043 [Polaribacter sp. KT25b]